tara:strand:+ start:909 stop:1235 length:327 start_codon:yes stop_codon:yes gene_type:complete
MTNFWKAVNTHKAIKPQPVELRLYYNDAGIPISYTTADLPEKYIVVAQQDFAQARFDVIIKEGKITRPGCITEVRKLVPGEDGAETLISDITLMGKGKHWKVKYYDAS